MCSSDLLDIPVFGSGDCTEPEHAVDRLRTGADGILIGRGVLRNPWILAQASDVAAGRAPRTVTAEDRGRFLLEYIELLMHERLREAPGFRHRLPGAFVETEAGAAARAPRSHDRWVVNKIRALAPYFTKGLDGGSKLRTAINRTETLDALRGLISEAFDVAVSAGPDARG